ncbi:PIN-like domain-containing protein [Bacillus cytotoxicus]|uniref:PIN-like domain-containing protein n=1 Tax=Bacillus cytotoxicus TaxID=580165 RepID=UPI002447FBDD|nr:PIN domain-containing protein [Bacillus cytotoxicus]MDH2861941.1 PIN domain-containing protein [Bacillus cytotoxicus]
MAYEYPLEEFKKVWDESPIIIFDTSSFCHLYKYTPETTTEFLEVLELVPREQFWIPKQVIDEFNENHQEVINTAHSKYAAVTGTIEGLMLSTASKITRQFKKYNEFRYPSVKELEGKIQHAFKSINEEIANYTENIKEEAEKNKEMLKEDKVKAFVDGLISSERIGEGFNYTQTLLIYSEGEMRYKYQIPPGYEDLEKDKRDATKRKKFGDLIVWKEILKKAEETKKPIIFVTMDEKEDWWTLDKNNEPQMPREELGKEFGDYSDATFVMMNLQNFYNNFSTIVEKVRNIKSYLEINGESICEELIDIQEWQTVLSSNGEFESYLVHSGQIQDFFSDVVENVEVNDYPEPEIWVNSVELVDDQVIIEADFTSRVGANVTRQIFREYTVTEDASLTVSGYITFQFKVDLESQDDFGVASGKCGFTTLSTFSRRFPHF